MNTKRSSANPKYSFLKALWVGILFTLIVFEKEPLFAENTIFQKNDGPVFISELGVGLNFPGTSKTKYAALNNINKISDPIGYIYHAGFGPMLTKQIGLIFEFNTLRRPIEEGEIIGNRMEVIEPNHFSFVVKPTIFTKNSSSRYNLMFGTGIGLSYINQESHTRFYKTTREYSWENATQNNFLEPALLFLPEIRVTKKQNKMGTLFLSYKHNIPLRTPFITYPQISAGISLHVFFNKNEDLETPKKTE